MIDAVVRCNTARYIKNNVKKVHFKVCSVVFTKPLTSAFQEALVDCVL